MPIDRLLNAVFILGSAYLLGRKLEKEKTWKQVVKFFPGDDGERLYNSTPEFLYGLFLSTAFVSSQESFSVFDDDAKNTAANTDDDSDIGEEKITGLYL